MANDNELMMDPKAPRSQGQCMSDESSMIVGELRARGDAERPGIVLSPPSPPIRPESDENTIDDDSEEPVNSELRKILVDLEQAARLSLLMAAEAPEQQFQADTLEEASRAFVESLPPEQKTNFRTAARTLAQAPKDLRVMEFGRYGKLDPKEFLKLGGFDRAPMAMEPLEIDPTLLGIKERTVEVPLEALQSTREGFLLARNRVPDLVDAVDRRLSRSAAASDDVELVEEPRLQELWGIELEASTRAMEEEEFEEKDLEDVNVGVMMERKFLYDEVALEIITVKCIDETGGKLQEKLMKDRMSLGGITIDAFGTVRTVKSRKIGTYKDGTVKKFSPPLTFAKFDLRAENPEGGASMPKGCTFMPMVFERDLGGGGPKFIATLAAKLAEKLKQKIVGLGGSKLLKLVLKIIGKLVSWVLKKIWNWIQKLAKDDLFPSMVVTTKVNSLTSGYGGKPCSKNFKKVTAAHRGSYAFEMRLCFKRS